VAGTAGAKAIAWHGTVEVFLGTLQPQKIVGAGVATVHTSSSNHLNMLRLAGGITGSATIPVTDPETTGTIPSIRVNETLGTGTLSKFIHTATSHHVIDPHNTLPIGGFTRVCLLTTSCTAFLPLNNTTNNGATGVGVGGLLTIGKFGAIRISLVNQPWAISTATLTYQTHEGGFTTRAQHGFLHNASSTPSSSNTATSKVVQLIAATNVATSGIAGNSTVMTLFSVLTLHFIPEPGLLLLIGSGVVGLGLLGRSRMKK
jgi:hypothetical protein